ncbi:MAG TPA: DUF5007 domain-containing protein [Chitinophaga sp.]|uniref:DUF5007 domain-containing protein n=1 Tax=Chitinophaga sp. TaxID=1869181 RepID=UPI002DBF9846|nr:DUF5007 domain-containing protein [Chitinophaga sp.]HEU4554761.1 DUF5007 domain-containing protein [Chitinophaga sp.]
MQRNKIHLILLLLSGIAMAGCYKNMVPDEKDFFSTNMNYNRTNFPVNLGRTNVYSYIFNADYSTQPLTFTLENIRHADSSAAPELQENVAARQWKDYYSGKEATIAEIEAKRTTEQRPVLDIRPHSGEIFFWNTDSGRVKPGLYYFDVRVKNGGGEKVFRNMVLDVRRPKPYEPYEFDDITGVRKAPDQGGITHPDISGVVDQYNLTLPRDSVVVYFRKTDIKGNTLTFKIFDADSLAIPFSRFNLTQWDSLRYRSNMIGQDIAFGFNRRMSEDSTVLTYDVTSPFPMLADVSGNSDKAYIAFQYNRVSFGHRYNAGIGLSFAIYEPGDWEVIFKFRVNPKFQDD